MLCSLSDIEKQKPFISGQIRLNFIYKHFTNFRIFRIIFLILFVSFLSSNLYAQVSKEEDVLLTFRYPAVGHVYVSHLYNENNGQSFLPVAELFGLLGIYYNPDFSNFVLKGTFLTNELSYEIDLKKHVIKLGEKEIPLNADDFRIGELDFFLSPSVYEKVFGLNFTIDILQLTLTLETDKVMPVQERKLRDVKRNKANSSNQEAKEFPLLYPRKRHLFSGAFLDYSVTGDISKDTKSLNLNNAGGMEFLGGDLSARLSANVASGGYKSILLNGLRWRYINLNNPYLSEFNIGQLNTTSIQSIAIRGATLSNDPIEPRRTFNTYVVDGNTVANSEVELYENDQLVEFKRSDELGYYRFDIPLSYGTSRVSIHIYTPTGQTNIIDRQIEVPYTFLPQGTLQYQVQAGVPENKSDSLSSSAIISHGNVGYGLTNWLTAKVGADYIKNDPKPRDPFYYSSVSARIASQYLLNIDIAPQAFYRFIGSVNFASNRSFSFAYTNYTGISAFNARGITEDFEGNIFLPFKIFGNDVGFRIGGQHTILPASSITRYQANISSRLGPINLRLDYSDFMTITKEGIIPGRPTLTSVLTYIIARKPGVPVFLQGMFIRNQSAFNIADKQLQTTELQFSRSARKSGRINLNIGYNIPLKILSLQVGTIVDLDNFRSTTTGRSIDKTYSLRQTVSGSLGYDAEFKKMTIANRQQVGKASASVLLYVDLNNSGKYDRGDERLPYKAVKIDGSSQMKVGKDGILRISQLQAYHKYQLTVVRSSIPNPTLVPLISELSFVVDPNQYKRIEIPFYRGGVIGGTISVQKNKEITGQSGLRLIIKDVNTDYTQTIKTFNDGGFYVMDLPPGEYTLEVDPSQLKFLGVENAKPLEFEIKALAEGDFIEDLNMTLKIKKKDDEDKK